MTSSRRSTADSLRKRRLGTMLAAIVVCCLVASGCSSSNTPATPVTTAPRGGPITTPSDAGLGVVRIPAGEPVPVRPIVTQTGPADFLGAASEAAIELAVADFGEIRGFPVDLGTPIDDGCGSIPVGGLVQNEIDNGVVGFIGATCRGTDVEIGPVVSGSGAVAISPSVMAPDLTSDGAGIAGVNRRDGYYRTVRNATADAFLVADALGAGFFNRDSVLGEPIDRVAVVHDETLLTETVAVAFATSTSGAGFEVVQNEAVPADVAAYGTVVANLAAADAQLLFMPLFAPEAPALLTAVRAEPALADLIIVVTSSVLQPSAIESGLLDDVYVVIAPAPEPGQVAATGQSAADVLVAVEAAGVDPANTFWANAYDATLLLLTAIDQVSRVEGGELVIDRLELRNAIAATDGLAGLTGALTCDRFGDCAAPRLVLVQHQPESLIENTKTNVVFP